MTKIYTKFAITEINYYCNFKTHNRNKTTSLPTESC